MDEDDDDKGDDDETKAITMSDNNDGDDVNDDDDNHEVEDDDMVDNNKFKQVTTATSTIAIGKQCACLEMTFHDEIHTTLKFTTGRKFQIPVSL